MVMHQPGWAHMASELAVTFLGIYLVICLVGLFIDPLRGLTDPVKIAKLKKDRRWAEWVSIATLGQIVAVHYSHAFDWPHQVSVWTWIIAGCGIFAPMSGFLRRWLDKKPTKPKPSRQEQQPYYTAGRTKR